MIFRIREYPKIQNYPNDLGTLISSLSQVIRISVLSQVGDGPMCLAAWHKVKWMLGSSAVIQMNNPVPIGVWSVSQLTTKLPVALCILFLLSKPARCYSDHP